MTARARFVLLIATATLAVATTFANQTRPPFNKGRVRFKSGALTLVGFLYAPDGPGPFPALVWNHRSERNPGTGPQFDTIASFFVPAGYDVFAPMRRGHGFSEGTYITDAIDEIRKEKGPAAAQDATVRLLATEQLDDQLAGLDHVKHRDSVDTTRLAVAVSPAALSWNGNPLLRDRLVRAVRAIDMPVMILQPPKDASLEPIRVLGAEFTRLHKPYAGKLYPATGPEDEQTHCFGGAKGTHVWAADAVAFLSGVLRK